LARLNQKGKVGWSVRNGKKKKQGGGTIRTKKARREEGVEPVHKLIVGTPIREWGGGVCGAEGRGGILKQVKRVHCKPGNRLKKKAGKKSFFR